MEQENSIEMTGKSRDSLQNIFINLYKLEVERVKYVLKAYLRARLAKVSAGDYPLA